MSDYRTEAHVSIPGGFIAGSSFPELEVETCIRDKLDDQLGTQSLLRPRVASASEPEIDSLVVIEVICAIEEVLGVNLPSSFAPRGGYDDVEACVSDLLAKTQTVWVEVVKEEQHHE
jgi:acyl carrier protein